MLRTEGEDYVALWEIVSVNINAEEGNLFCVDVSLINSDKQEGDEEFKVEIEIFDINAFVPPERRTARVLILDQMGNTINLIVTVINL